MATLDYIPPSKELTFLPEPPDFGRGARWILEIGPGKGELILSQAQENPQINFIAIEIRRGRFEKIARQAQNLGLTNLFVVLGDARECLPRLFPENFFEKIYILFPDPWPKKKHVKHRLLKARLITQLRSLLRPGGEVFHATDAAYYAEQIVAAFQEVGGFECVRETTPYGTYFERKWKKLGRPIEYWRFLKSSSEI